MLEAFSLLYAWSKFSLTFRLRMFPLFRAIVNFPLNFLYISIFMGIRAAVLLYLFTLHPFHSMPSAIFWDLYARVTMKISTTSSPFQRKSSSPVITFLHSKIAGDFALNSKVLRFSSRFDAKLKLHICSVWQSRLLLHFHKELLSTDNGSTKEFYRTLPWLLKM